MRTAAVALLAQCIGCALIMPIEEIAPVVANDAVELSAASRQAADHYRGYRLSALRRVESRALQARSAIARLPTRARNYLEAARQLHGSAPILQPHQSSRFLQTHRRRPPGPGRSARIVLPPWSNRLGKTISNQRALAPISWSTENKT